MKALWERVEALLVRVAPKSVTALRAGAPEEDLAALERELGRSLPDDLTEFLRIHDGQVEPYMSAMFVDGEYLLSCRGIAETWNVRNGVVDSLGLTQDAGTGLWWDARLVPFTECEGNGYCVDAATGAVYYHVHDGVLEGPLWPSLRLWMEAIARVLEEGRFRVELGAVWLDLNTSGGNKP